MKTPRVSDFYPDAKVPELKSSLDKMPTIQKPQPIPALEIKKSPVQPDLSKPDRAIERPDVRPCDVLFLDMRLKYMMIRSITSGKYRIRKSWMVSLEA